jgi:hypothetical protein
MDLKEIECEGVDCNLTGSGWDPVACCCEIPRLFPASMSLTVVMGKQDTAFCAMPYFRVCS